MTYSNNTSYINFKQPSYSNTTTSTSTSNTMTINSSLKQNSIYIPNPTSTATITTSTSDLIWNDYYKYMQILEEKLDLEKIKEPEQLTIVKVEILCPDKVLRFTFNDNSTIKTICTKNDTFDFEFAFYIAFAKKEFGHIYTAEGIYDKAKEMQHMKEYVKKVNSAIKLYNRDLKEKEKEEKEKEERKLIKQNRIKKQQEKKHKAKQMRITEIEEAIRRASLTLSK